MIESLLCTCVQWLCLLSNVFHHTPVTALCKIFLWWSVIVSLQYYPPPSVFAQHFQSKVGSGCLIKYSIPCLRSLMMLCTRSTITTQWLLWLSGRTAALLVVYYIWKISSTLILEALKQFASSVVTGDNLTCTASDRNLGSGSQTKQCICIYINTQWLVILTVKDHERCWLSNLTWTILHSWIKVTRSPVFSRSTNLESKLIAFFVFVNL